MSRKIKNNDDFFNFETDFLSEANEGARLLFAVGQDNNRWDGFFEAEKCAGLAWYHPLEESEQDKPLSGVAFLDGLLGNYKLPFYICDPGANYKWLDDNQE